MKKVVLQYLEAHPPAKILFDELVAAGDIYLLGGVLREYLDHHAICELRDIDIVVGVKNRHRWEKTLNTYSVKRNRFGGNKLHCDGLLVDVWAVEKTWAYRENIVKCEPEHYVDRLAETVFLNIDGIIYDWQRDTWDDAEYRDAMRTKVLDVVLPENPQLCLNIFRTFLLQNRYQMQLSERLKAIIMSEYNKFAGKKEFLDAMMKEQQRRYEREIISSSELDRMLCSVTQNYYKKTIP